MTDENGGAAPQRLRFAFTATGNEYFRIWIVNLALTIITLGIYSAWAKVRKLRYFYGSTTLAGSTFGYHAPPLAILKGRLLAVALGALYFIAIRFSPAATAIIIVLIFIALPWLVVRSRMFAMHMTSWRGVRFGFAPDYRGAYAAFLGWMALGVLTFGILLPRAVRERLRFVVSRTSFGSTPFECAPRIGRFYKTAFAAFGLLLLFVLLLGAVFGGVTAATRASGETASRGAVLIGAQGVFTVGYLLIFVVLNAYVQSRNLNETFATTRVGPVQLHSRLRARRLAGIYLGNILGIVFTLGLYTPWAQVRLARYRLDALELEATGSLEAFAAGSGAAPNAVSEEISELLDVEFGL